MSFCIHCKLNMINHSIVSSMNNSIHFQYFLDSYIKLLVNRKVFKYYKTNKDKNLSFELYINHVHRRQIIYTRMNSMLMKGILSVQKGNNALKLISSK